MTFEKQPDKISQTQIYRKFPDGYVVREMSSEDLETVINWWTKDRVLVKIDYTLFFNSYPRYSGFFMGEKDGKPVATCIRIPANSSKNIFFGDWYFVDENFRGKGYGTRLRDNIAKKHVNSNVLVVDATDDAILANEKKFGYVKDSYRVIYYSGQVTNITLCNLGGISYSIAEQKDFHEIIEYDNKVFITSNCLSRKNILDALFFKVKNAKTIVARNMKGDIVGFGERRITNKETHHYVGPLYADNTNIALNILYHLKKGLNEESYFKINVYDVNVEWVSKLHELQFKGINSCQRMQLNGYVNVLNPKVFGITSISSMGF